MTEKDFYNKKFILNNKEPYRKELHYLINNDDYIPHNVIKKYSILYYIMKNEEIKKLPNIIKIEGYGYYFGNIEYEYNDINEVKLIEI